jgi:hypothetical protein
MIVNERLFATHVDMMTEKSLLTKKELADQAQHTGTSRSVPRKDTTDSGR